MMSLNLVAQVILSPYVERLLFANGAIDREQGRSINEGWADVCLDLGWNDEGNTPAKERYTDGWNSVKEPEFQSMIH
jgi:hypothetical protein